MNDNFFDIDFDNLKVEINREPFKIRQLKLSNYYWVEDDYYIGMPISTSVELICKYDFEKDILNWSKIVSHTYLNFDDGFVETTDSYIEELGSIDEVISKLEKEDLRDLKNNYFTDKEPENFTHWEIVYNKYFKIVGTYDQELDVFKEFSELLDFKGIMKEEIEKVKNKFS